MSPPRPSGLPPAPGSVTSSPSEPTQASRGSGYSLLNLEVTVGTQSNALYDRCATEHTPPREPPDLANLLVRRAVRTQKERRARRLRCRPAIYPSRLNPGTEIAVPLVRGRTVGLGGLEPPTSSLSAIERLPLCNPAFSQVMCDRRGPSNALLRFRPTSAQTGRRGRGQGRRPTRRRQGDGAAGWARQPHRAA